MTSSRPLASAAAPGQRDRSSSTRRRRWTFCGRGLGAAAPVPPTRPHLRVFSGERGKASARVVTTLGFPARLAGRGRVRGARREEKGGGSVARRTPLGLAGLRPLHGPPRDPPWGRARAQLREDADEAGLGAEGRRRRGYRLSRGRLPAGPPPGSPLDPLWGWAPTSGALGDRALPRVGPALECNSQALGDSGVVSAHVRPGRARPRPARPIFQAARPAGRSRRAPGPSPALPRLTSSSRRPSGVRAALRRSLPGGERQARVAGRKPGFDPPGPPLTGFLERASPYF